MSQGTNPASLLVVAEALPSSCGHATFGRGKVKSNAKSKSTAHEGAQLGPVLVFVTTRSTTARGSPPHVTWPFESRTTVADARASIDGHGAGGTGIWKSKSKSKEQPGVEPQLSKVIGVVLVTVTWTYGSAVQAFDPRTTVRFPSAVNDGQGTRCLGI